jgi:deoxyribose-phosphate aldolase
MASTQLAPIPRLGLARYFDHTYLKPDAKESDIERLCLEAVRYGFWSVCVSPCYVRNAKQRLLGSGVRVCAVIGFPLGYSVTSTKLAEAKIAIEDGADELDMVMNIGAFKSGEYDLVSDEIKDVAESCKSSGKLLKVIIECCYLTDDEKVRASRLAELAGADYIKTSTGFGPSGATIADVALIKRSLTRGTKVKAAGGIRTLAMALEMIRAGADRLGASESVKIMDEAARTPSLFLPKTEKSGPSSVDK